MNVMKQLSESLHRWIDEPDDVSLDAAMRAEPTAGRVEVESPQTRLQLARQAES